MAQRGVVVLAQPGQYALIELAGEILKQPAVGEQILVRHQRLPQRADGGEQLVEQRHRPAVVAALADRLAAPLRRTFRFRHGLLEQGTISEIERLPAAVHRPVATLTLLLFVSALAQLPTARD